MFCNQPLNPSILSFVGGFQFESVIKPNTCDGTIVCTQPTPGAKRQYQCNVNVLNA